MGKPYICLVVLKFKEEYRQEVYDMLATSEDGLALTRKHKACISIEGRLSTDDDETIVFWGKWTSKEGHSEYLAMRKETGLFDSWADKYAAPPTSINLTEESF